MFRTNDDWLELGLLGLVVVVVGLFIVMVGYLITNVVGSERHTFSNVTIVEKYYEGGSVSSGVGVSSNGSVVPVVTSTGPSYDLEVIVPTIGKTLISVERGTFLRVSKGDVVTLSCRLGSLTKELFGCRDMEDPA